MISREAWLAACRADFTDDPEALTAKELAELLGVSVKNGYVAGERLVQLGKAVITQKRASHPGAGGRGYVKAYRLKESP